MQDARGSAKDLHDEHDEEQVDLDGDEEDPGKIKDEGDVEEEEKNDG